MNDCLFFSQLSAYFQKRKEGFHLFSQDRIPLCVLFQPSIHILQQAQEPSLLRQRPPINATVVELAEAGTTLIRPAVFPLNVIDKRGVNHFVSAWSWVVSGKIPVAGIVRTSLVQILDGLVNDLNLGLAVIRF